MDRETADEIKRHFNVVAEGLRSEIRAVAEGLEGFREEVSGEFRAVREEISEVKAMIRLSFGELDRRMRSLETDVASGAPRKAGSPLLTPLGPSILPRALARRYVTTTGSKRAPSAWLQRVSDDVSNP